MSPELRAALLAQVEARQALNSLADDATAEERSAAVDKLNQADQTVAELLAAAPSAAPPELRDRISLGRYLRGAAEERALDGAEGELRTELRLADNVIPLEAMMPTVEERQDAISPQDAAGDALESGAINRTTGPLLTRVFTATDGAFLGVPMPMVPPGERRYPVMVGGTDAAMQARGAGPDAGAAKFDVVDVNPHRLTGRYVLDLEGVAEMGGLLESTLRSDLRTVMGYQMDRQMLLGTGAANQVSGILAELDRDVQPGTTIAAKQPNSALTWALSKQLGYGPLDGRYFPGSGSLRYLIGKDTLDLMRTLYRGNDVESMDGHDVLTGQGVRVRVSYQLAASGALTWKGQDAAGAKKGQDAVLTAMPTDAVMPVWQGLTMIRDPYTEAKGAQVVLTAHMLFGFVFRRKDSWRKYGIRLET